MNIVYNASAGTGKTYSVTQLYEELVLKDGIDPRKILLMTFTENAAAELRMRVSHRLIKARRIAESEGDDERTERAMTATARLASAPIGTIHSYCTRLLREHALDAGLSPGFSVLVGDERDELLNRICREELLAQLESDPDFKAFCAGAHIIGSGRGFGSSVTETVPALIAQAGSLGIALENAESLLPDAVPSVSRIDFENICSRILELPNITPAVQQALDLIRQALDESVGAEDLVDRMESLGIRKFGRGGAKQISDDFWELKERVIAARRYRERFPAAKAFARYVERVVQRFYEAKHEMNGVDFDDLLSIAARLLKSGRAVTDFRYVIVDEVQDTSRIQCDLIECLWHQQDTRLVICGDKKQSIYTWRGADPQVMPDLEKAILSAGGEPRHLQTSYRSKASILEVVNKLFAAVYGPDDYSDEDNLKPNTGFATDGEKACIEFLSPDEDDEEASKKEKAEAEMEAVANRIRLLVNGEPRWRPSYRFNGQFEPVSADNRYRYSDILILLRRTTHQSMLEQALRHAGIPYTLGGKGRGLFTRQETRDVSLFLNVLTNPSDTYSLIGFLRSPWIGLSDEEIAELSWGPDGFSELQLRQHYADKTDVIDRYREKLGTKLASELVRMLIDETGYDALLAGLPRGTQRLANLRKVLDWLRETERGAHTTTAAVARKLAEQISNPPQIPEAALLDPAQNAVTIMTVHGSKGLTKRVVFVPDISFSDNSDRSFAQVFFDEQKRPGLGLRISAPDRSSVVSPGFKDANDRAKAVRLHESRNLFYVAMTRARDLVVTSASVGRKPSGWLEQMEPLIGDDIPLITYSTLRQTGTTIEQSEAALPTVDQLSCLMNGIAPPPTAPKLHRLPATRLARETDELEPDYEEAEGPAFQTADKAAALGSLGHAVLEQLALNEWQGSVDEWLQVLRHDFQVDKHEASTLGSRIESARGLMMELTSNMSHLQPEFAFVLHREHRLIDGTIDLLCRTPDGYAIYDYKFTEGNDDHIIGLYRSQMEIYTRAAEHRYPYAGESRLGFIAVSSAGARLVPIEF